jgi:hypothetical protein
VERSRKEEEVMEEVGKFLLTAYILDSLDYLPEEQQLRLAELGEETGANDWREATRRGLDEEYGLTAEAIRAIYAGCINYMDGMHSLMFVLRGVGIFTAQETLTKLMGRDVLQELGESIVKEHPRPK